MRLEEIEKLKRELNGNVQHLMSALHKQELNPMSHYKSRIPSRIKFLISPIIFPFFSYLNKRNFNFNLGIKNYMIGVGHRFQYEFMKNKLLTSISSNNELCVLLPGTQFNSKECRDWLSCNRAGCVHLMDIFDWNEGFENASDILTRWYGTDIEFNHGALDQLPFDGETFDVIETRAVLEHVGNMKASVKEMARVLKTDGIAFHSFGPLYFSYGGDHTISSYGTAFGFDHLLLDDKEYYLKIHDESFYGGLGKVISDSRFWAIQGIFSYLKVIDYLNYFKSYFDILYCLVSVSSEALLFKKNYPEKWEQLKSAGLGEQDLLIDGIQVILKKK